MNNGIFQSDLAAVKPQELLKPESWLSKIEFINHLILFNNVLITVLSEKQGGKTSFATLLQENLDPQIKLLLIKIKAPCSREEIISDIATQFHLKYNENTDISSLVAQINERRAHVVLMIDEAQHLPEIFIKEAMLAIKNQENFNFFHLCLLSDYSIVGALNAFSSSFFNDLVHTIELGSLNESEAKTYVLQRAMANHLITKPLSDAQLKQLYQLTKGNVAKINNSLESFIFNSSNKKPSSMMDLAQKVGIPTGAALFSGIICLLVGKFVYQDPANTMQSDKAGELAGVLSSQIASWQESSTRQLVEHSLAAKQNLDALNKRLPKEGVAIADKAVHHARIKSNARTFAKTRAIRQEIGHNQLASTKRANKKLYTIQLVASPDKADMERYRKNYKLLYDSAKLGHYVENKVVWYVLTIGEYSSMNEAQQSIVQLPPSLIKLNPWVRNISSLG